MLLKNRRRTRVRLRGTRVVSPVSCLLAVVASVFSAIITTIVTGVVVMTRVAAGYGKVLSLFCHLRQEGSSSCKSPLIRQKISRHGSAESRIRWRWVLQLRHVVRCLEKPSLRSAGDRRGAHKRGYFVFKRVVAKRYPTFLRRPATRRFRLRRDQLFAQSPSLNRYSKRNSGPTPTVPR